MGVKLWIIVGAALLTAACGGERADTARPAKPCLTNIGEPHPGKPTDGMVWINGGTFEMGARPKHAEEGPPRQTRVKSFWIDRTEVTNDQFARFVKATGYVTLAERPLDPKAYPKLTGDQLKPSSVVFAADAPEPGWRIIQGADWRHPLGPKSSIKGRGSWPVVHIAWADAMAYARWLGRDLPTEAEWEYAARGGKDGATYVWGDDKKPSGKPAANHWQGVFPIVDTGEDGYKARTAPVGCFAPNGYGLYDMAGNVWEWTKDWYRPGLDPEGGPDGPAPDRAFDPADPGVPKHVLKGGSFLCADNFCFRYRPAARQPGPTDTGASHTGFRTVYRGGAP